MQTLKRIGKTAGWSAIYYLMGMGILFIGAQLYRAAFPFGWEGPWLLSPAFWVVATAYGLCFALLVATPAHLLAARYIQSNRWCAILAGTTALVVGVACFVLLMSLTSDGGCGG